MCSCLFFFAIVAACSVQRVRFLAFVVVVLVVIEEVAVALALAVAVSIAVTVVCGVWFVLFVVAVGFGAFVVASV